MTTRVIARPSAARSAATADSPVPFSIRLLRRAKPLVLALLRSPLHRLLSADILALTWRGRRSGREYTLPLSYVRAPDRNDVVYLCTRPEGSRWWRNFRGGVECHALVGGRRCRAQADVLDPDSDEALAGLRLFVTRNPGTGRMLYNIEPRRDGNGPTGPDPEDLAREVANSVVLRLRLS